MKFYNPFKPHIVRFKKESIYIRKLSFCGWVYLGEYKYWWSDLFRRHAFKFTDVKTAKEYLENIKEIVEVL